MLTEAWAAVIVGYVIVGALGVLVLSWKQREWGGTSAPSRWHRGATLFAIVACGWQTRELLWSGELGDALVAWLVLAAAVLVIRAATHAVTRYGMVNGFVLFIACEEVKSLWLPTQGATIGAVAVALVATLALVILWIGWSRFERRVDPEPFLSTSILPVVNAYYIVLAIQGLSLFLRSALRAPLVFGFAHISLALVSCAGIVAASYPVRYVKSSPGFLVRAGAATCFAVALTCAFQVLRPIGPLTMGCVTAAVLWDALRETRFRFVHPAALCVGSVQALFTLGPLRDRLDDAGIPHLLRFTASRTLFQYFGPFVDVELWVPAPHEQAATRILGEQVHASLRRNYGGPQAAASARSTLIIDAVCAP